MGEHHAAVGAVDLAAGLKRGQALEPVGVDDAAVGGGRASRSGQSEGGTEPTNASPAAARWAKLACEFCPASNTTVICGPALPAAVAPSGPAVATAVYRATRRSIMAANWVTSGRLPG